MITTDGPSAGAGAEAAAPSHGRNCHLGLQWSSTFGLGLLPPPHPTVTICLPPALYHVHQRNVRGPIPGSVMNDAGYYGQFPVAKPG